MPASALNPTVSADGSVIVFVSDVDHEGSSDVHKGDLEVFLHHVHTRTTRRVTYTYNDKADETFPHIAPMAEPSSSRRRRTTARRRR